MSGKMSTFVKVNDRTPITSINMDMNRHRERTPQRESNECCSIAPPQMTAKKRKRYLVRHWRLTRASECPATSRWLKPSYAEANDRIDRIS